jgi:hypothetical protein
MAGMLKIFSNVGGDQFLGHSWIEYCPVDGIPVTYGTWGNSPTGAGNGLFENLELGRDASACRATYISDEQENRLLEKISDYKRLGSNAWSLHRPCSTFAADAWYCATGEWLTHRMGPVSTPTLLAASIAKVNGERPSLLGICAASAVSLSSKSVRKKNWHD